MTITSLSGSASLETASVAPAPIEKVTLPKQDVPTPLTPSKADSFTLMAKPREAKEIEDVSTEEGTETVAEEPSTQAKKKKPNATRDAMLGVALLLGSLGTVAGGWSIIAPYLMKQEEKVKKAIETEVASRVEAELKKQNPLNLSDLTGEGLINSFASLLGGGSSPSTGTSGSSLDLGTLLLTNIANKNNLDAKALKTSVQALVAQFEKFTTGKIEQQAIMSSIKDVVEQFGIDLSTVKGDLDRLVEGKEGITLEKVFGFLAKTLKERGLNGMPDGFDAAQLRTAMQQKLEELLPSEYKNNVDSITDAISSAFTEGRLDIGQLQASLEEIEGVSKIKKQVIDFVMEFLRKPEPKASTADAVENSTNWKINHIQIDDEENLQ